MGDNKQNARFPSYDSAKTMRDSKGDHDGGHEHKSLGREDETNHFPRVLWNQLPQGNARRRDSGSRSKNL